MAPPAEVPPPAEVLAAAPVTEPPAVVAPAEPAPPAGDPLPIATALDDGIEAAAGPVHILSPFDPLVIQRKRLALFFGYDHRFEAYVPKEKRVYGYFACPVLVGDAIVAAIDLKTDRTKGKLLVQQWTWLGDGARKERKRRIEEALHAFERFQLAR